ILPPLCLGTRLSESASRLARASAARCAAGRRERKTSGLVAADTCGTRLTLVEFARHVCTSGAKLNAFPADAGPRTLSGTRNHEMLLTEQAVESGMYRFHAQPWRRSAEKTLD